MFCHGPILFFRAIPTGHIDRSEPERRAAERRYLSRAAPRSEAPRRKDFSHSTMLRAGRFAPDCIRGCGRNDGEGVGEDRAGVRKCHEFRRDGRPLRSAAPLPCFLHTGLAVPGRFAGREYANRRPPNRLFVHIMFLRARQALYFRQRPGSVVRAGAKPDTLAGKPNCRPGLRSQRRRPTFRAAVRTPARAPARRIPAKRRPQAKAGAGGRGEVPERSNGAVSKTVVRLAYRGFESHPLRHYADVFLWRICTHFLYCRIIPIFHFGNSSLGRGKCGTLGRRQGPAPMLRSIKIPAPWVPDSLWHAGPDL